MTRNKATLIVTNYPCPRCTTQYLTLAQYPDEVPEFVVQYSHILPKQAAELTAYLKAEAEDLKGTVRLFTPGPDGVSDA